MLTGAQTQVEWASSTNNWRVEMNVGNLVVITAALLIWSQIVQWTIPTWTGRSLIGVLGAIVIGASFAIAGITVVGV